MKTGNLLHLKTEIQGIIHNNTNLNELVLLLHPTPAVAGLPMIKAIHFINKWEGYKDRYANLFNSRY